MGIIGAILGDIAGSQYEYDRPKDLDWKKCELYTENCEFTDDTVMSLAIKSAVDKGIDYQTEMRRIGHGYPLCGYGDKFFEWIYCTNPRPYNSFGNGSAMRVSYIGEHFDKLPDVLEEAKKSAMVSHSHPEGIKGAEVTAVLVWMARHDQSKMIMLDYVNQMYPEEKYKYHAGRTLEDIRQTYSWDVTCMTSVPVAFRCFYESEDYISFIRNVFSLDCDCDTLCAIGGGIAESYYKKTGLKNRKILEHYLTSELLEILDK